ncbi:AraC family transcriptional regulator [Vagococcus sp. DIV0080]|uniref:AraC family transcriptional regulator n=1 Tax=Candidatus Vagococcus giribetii TaxID=2230876 RepID=A0ABS3HVL7_9ENTE|nr:AraC family transcriptional regulator [Vagococcus sp. DIV0080]MBO0477796.1 AraC family transcriptional regulator [Vagococcus sp. DIV0080]
MVLSHEFIEYTHELIPINWIIHGSSHSASTVLPHWHTSFEISYTYAGNIENYTISNVTHRTEPGTVLLINSAEVHGATSSYCADLEALTIQIPYEFISKLIPDFEYMRFINRPTGKAMELNELREVLSEFYHLTKREVETELLDLQLLTLTYRLLFLLARDWGNKETAPINSNLYTEKLDQIQPIISFIQENYKEALTVGDIAEHFHVSTNYLSKLFKKNLGLSVMKYVQYVRINRGQELLLHSDKPIHVISDIVGFPNEKSFRKTFEEVFHQTPKKYQLNYKQANGRN